MIEVNKELDPAVYKFAVAYAERLAKLKQSQMVFHREDEIEPQYRLYHFINKQAFKEAHALLEIGYPTLFDEDYQLALRRLTGGSTDMWQITLQNDFQCGDRYRIFHPQNPDKLLMEFPLFRLKWMSGRDTLGSEENNNRSVISNTANQAARILITAIPYDCPDREARDTVIETVVQSANQKYNQLCSDAGFSHMDLLKIRLRFSGVDRPDTWDVIKYLRTLPSGRIYDGFFEHYWEISPSSHRGETPSAARAWNEYFPTSLGDDDMETEN